MDKVLQMSTEELGVLDGIDFVLVMIVYEFQWRGRLNMLDRKDHGSVRSKKDLIENCRSCG